MTDKTRAEEIMELQAAQSSLGKSALVLAFRIQAWRQEDAVQNWEKIQQGLLLLETIHLSAAALDKRLKELGARRGTLILEPSKIPEGLEVHHPIPYNEARIVPGRSSRP